MESLFPWECNLLISFLWKLQLNKSGSFIFPLTTLPPSYSHQPNESSMPKRPDLTWQTFVQCLKSSKLELKLLDLLKLVNLKVAKFGTEFCTLIWKINWPKRWVGYHSNLRYWWRTSQKLLNLELVDKERTW